jgi:dihydroorotate dehydrogenase (fumarate)
MVDLRTTYLGLDLKNPLIVGASSLTGTAKSARQIEEAGAGALVVRSLFEEQIQLERLVFDEDLVKQDNRYAEMLHFYPSLEHAGPDEHVEEVRQIRQSVHIPVLASLNAVSRQTWVEYAGRLEETGVDGLELNFYASPVSPETSGASIEEEQIATLAEIRKAVHVPIAVKLSPFYTNPLNVIHQLDDVGVNSFVLFNRLFQPEIDIHKEEHVSPLNLSRAEDSRLAMRFAGLLYGQIKADICSSTGILSGGQIVEMILAGATAVQTVSSLYQNGLSHITTLLREVEIWMESKGYARLHDFRGKLDQRHCSNPWVYTRAQYANLLMHPDEVLKNAPVL